MLLFGFSVAIRPWTSGRGPRSGTPPQRLRGARWSGIRRFGTATTPTAMEFLHRPAPPFDMRLWSRPHRCARCFASAVVGRGFRGRPLWPPPTDPTTGGRPAPAPRSS